MFKAGLFSVILIVVVACSWVGNLIKLTDCDFEAPYKCEAVHAIGLIPIVSLVTVWVDVEENIQP